MYSRRNKAWRWFAVPTRTRSWYCEYCVKNDSERHESLHKLLLRFFWVLAFAVNSKSARSCWKQTQEIICLEIALGQQKSGRLRAVSGVVFPKTIKCFHIVAFLYNLPLRLIVATLSVQSVFPWCVIIVLYYGKFSLFIWTPQRQSFYNESCQFLL